MKTNLVIGTDPKKFNDLVNKFITDNNKEGYIVRDIKYGVDGERFSALLMFVKLDKPF